VRRTSHLDVTRAAGTSAAPHLVSIDGCARDLVTPTSGEPAIVSSARLAVALDETGLIASVDQDPPSPSGAALLGTRVGFGFRSSVKGLLEELGETPLGLLVDDLSGAPAPSGYGSIRDRAVLGLPPVILEAPEDGAVHRQTDVCAGWRTDGLPLQRRQSGQPLPFADEPPVAPPLTSDDPLAWHPMGRLGDRQSRRIRRLDVWRDGDAVLVDTMFRDTITDPDADLTERVVHEYVVTATLHPATLTILALHADPRALPFPTDCPFAAGSADLLVGVRAPELRSEVRRRSRGPVSCTHLNDVFRTLADIGPLLAYIDG
jgi:hypothetical protein